MIAQFNRFSISMTRAQAASADHAGQCDHDVRALSLIPAIARQLRKLDHDAVRAELWEYGAWDDTELADHAENLQRVVWIAAGNIMEGV